MKIATFLCALAFAAAASAKPASSAKPAAEPLRWLKVYSLAPFKEIWTLSIKVPRFGRDRDRVEGILADAGAKLTHPAETFPATASSQQLSYTLSKKAAERALKKLKKIGTFAAPVVQPSAEPVSLPEVSEKLGRLNAERQAHLKELAAMPATSALVDETINHLATVKRVFEDTETEVLLNMTVEEKR